MSDFAEEDDDSLDWVERCKRDFATARLCEPGPSETVVPCHWSRTGWAVGYKEGGCSCRPALAPLGSEIAE